MTIRDSAREPTARRAFGGWALAGVPSGSVITAGTGVNLNAGLTPHRVRHHTGRPGVRPTLSVTSGSSAAADSAASTTAHDGLAWGAS